MPTAHTTHLYPRSDAYIPRIAAVHDMCGYGKCSLGVAIPVLSAAGCDVCPVPTALFSSHTLYPNFVMRDTTDLLNDYLDAWKGIDVDIDAVYSGFLGSAEQVEIIRSIYQTYPNALRIVDPVMADHGKVYPTYTPELCQAMASLAADATLLTPNLTEASIITGIEYEGQAPTDSYIHTMMDALLNKGAQYVVLKGIQRNNQVVNLVGGQNIEAVQISNQLLPQSLHGTGDLYCSAVLGALMAGKSLYDAVAFAGLFVIDAIQVTTKQPHYEMRGVSFEPVLGKVAQLISHA